MLECVPCSPMNIRIFVFIYVYVKAKSPRMPGASRHVAHLKYARKVFSSAGIPWDTKLLQGHGCNQRA